MPGIVKSLAGSPLPSRCRRRPMRSRACSFRRTCRFGWRRPSPLPRSQQCESMGYKVSVVVLDRDGLQVAMLRGDGAGLHTPEGADRKAYTARTYGSPSANFAKRVLSEPSYAQATQYNRVLALGGGLPIKVGNEVIGAVGVSGSPGKDEVCAQAGIDKVVDQLK